VGDGRSYIAVLLVLDPQVAPLWAKRQGIEASFQDLGDQPAVVAEIRRALTVANSHLSRIEQFKRFTILPAEWTPESEELTPTMKLKRRVIATKYHPQIEAMYASPPGGHSVDAERETANQPA
jgi:long-chain acyl-CoA synthetase